ncbi:MAG: hypothetical protein HY692_03040 [Cyanobacteria bacterium NC_groundwater_1444_Ag_S-0.65um_54_12]|nr:hypothetical protein [Cyanobacteria bacterium NC_groundwater_1444_Ag_S-0.65um_54_12]
MVDPQAGDMTSATGQPSSSPDTVNFSDELLAELLVSARLITPEQLAEAQSRLASYEVSEVIKIPRAFVANSRTLQVHAFRPTAEATAAELTKIPLGEATEAPAEWPVWSNNQILLLDASTPRVAGTVSPPPGAALGLFPTPDGCFLYPGLLPNHDLSPELLVLPSPSLAPAASDSRPIDLIGSPSGEFILACNRGAGSVHILIPNTASQLGAITIRAGGNKRSIGAAIHDRIAYLTDGLTSRLTILELTTLRARYQTFPTGPLGPVAITPDGQYLLLVFYKSSAELGLLTVSTGDLRVRHLLNLPGRKILPAPSELLCIASGGRLAYLVVQSASTSLRYHLLAIDLLRKKLASDILLDSLPLALALPPPRGWLPEKPSLKTIISDLGFATADEIRLAQERQPADSALQDPRLDPQIIGQLPERMIRSLGLVPLYREGNVLLVAMINPRDPAGLQLATQLAGGLQLTVIPVSEADFTGFLHGRYPDLMGKYYAMRTAISAIPAITPQPPTSAAQRPPATIAPPAVTGAITTSLTPPPALASQLAKMAANEDLAETIRLAKMGNAASQDSWIAPGGQRLLLVDTVRRQVVEISRERREIWAYRGIAAGSATYLPDGNILLADINGSRVLEIEPRSTQTIWCSAQEGEERRCQLRNPRGATRLSNGNTLIADTGNHRVIEIMPDGTCHWSYGEFGRAGCSRGSLFKPNGVWRAKNGNTLIADTGNHRVIEINETGEVVWQYGNHVNRLGGGQGSGVSQLSEPTFASRLGNGNIIIADTGNQRVLEVDDMRQILWHYRPGGARGGIPIRDPLILARTPEGSTLIAGRDGVIEVATDLRIVWEYHFAANRETANIQVSSEAPVMPNDSGSPAIRSETRIQEIPSNLPDTFLLTDRVRSRIVEIDRKMQVVWQFTGLVGGERNRIEHPHYAVRLINGNTLIADTGYHRVVEVNEKAIVWQFGRRGEEGSGPKQLASPRSAERYGNGTTLIADFGNRRVLSVNATQEVTWCKDNLLAPIYAARLSSGHVLIVDWGAHLVLEVDERGMPIWQFGQLGNGGKGLNQLFHPEHACRLDNGNTLICDTQNHRVLEVTPDKQIAWQYGGEPQFLGRKGRFAMQFLTPVVAWRLPNGQTIIHHAGSNHLVEVEPDLNISWHFTLAF